MLQASSGIMQGRSFPSLPFKLLTEFVDDPVVGDARLIVESNPDLRPILRLWRIPGSRIGGSPSHVEDRGDDGPKWSNNQLPTLGVAIHAVEFSNIFPGPG